MRRTVELAVLSSSPARAIRRQDRLRAIRLEPIPSAGLTPKELADDIGITLGTLRNWRTRRFGPPYWKLGKSVRYPRADYLAWRERNRVRTLK